MPSAAQPTPPPSSSSRFSTLPLAGVVFERGHHKPASCLPAPLCTHSLGGGCCCLCICTARPPCAPPPHHTRTPLATTVPVVALVAVPASQPPTRLHPVAPIPRPVCMLARPSSLCDVRHARRGIRAAPFCGKLPRGAQRQRQRRWRWRWQRRRRACAVSGGGHRGRRCRGAAQRAWRGAAGHLIPGADLCRPQRFVRCGFTPAAAERGATVRPAEHGVPGCPPPPQSAPLPLLLLSLSLSFSLLPPLSLSL